MRKFDYEAVPASSTERPYDGIVFNSHEKVAAVYTKSRNAAYNGNPLIEALPRPRNANEIADAYSKSLPLYSYSDVEKMEDYEKISQIALLKSIRIKPPFAISIENRFYLSQIVSYNSRNMITHNPGYSKEEETKDSELLFEALGSNPNEPITLLGYSGCGKSTAIETLLTDYPQVIEHNLEGTRFLQITYLYVECPANSNMSTLLFKIAEQVDLATGAGNTYRTKVAKAKSIGAKAAVVCSIFKAFAVGTLFLDEIQNIDFNLTKESTYATFLTISNETGANISVIGTEEAYDKMFNDLKLIRRVGDPIIASAYCQNKAYSSTAIKEITKYQWFDEYVDFTPEMIKAMYECTGGIFDQIITLYTVMNLDYIESPKGKKPTVNVEYITGTSEKHFPKIRSILEKLKEHDSAEADRMLHRFMEDARLQQDMLMEEARQVSEARSVVEELESEERQTREHLITNCIKNILNVVGCFTQEEIEKEVKLQIRKTGRNNPDEKAITRMAFHSLQEKKANKGKAKRAENTEANRAMKEQLKNSGYTGPIQGLRGE